MIISKLYEKNFNIKEYIVSQVEFIQGMLSIVLIVQNLLI